MRRRFYLPFLGLLFCCLVPFAEAYPHLSTRSVSFEELAIMQSSPSHPAPAVPTDLNALFAQGEAALRRNDLDAAEAAFRQVLAADPQAAGAYANLGVIAMRRKSWDRALRLLEKAAKLAPNVSGVRLNIGLVNFRRGDYAAAISPLTSVVQDQPDSQQARYLLGLCNLLTEHYADAVSALEPLWSQESSNFMYLYVLCIAADGANQKELSERALTRLIEVGGDTPEFHLMLGKAYLNRQESDKAVAELQRAAALNPSLPFVHFNLAIAYVRAGDDTHAVEEFHKDLAIEPDLADTYELLGEFYMQSGNDKDAEKSFHEALRRNSRMPGSLFGLAKIYLRQEKYQQALAAIDGAMPMALNSRNLHYLRGRILAKMGRNQAAEKEFTTAAKIEDASIQKDKNKGKDPETLEDGRLPNPELKQQPQ